MGSKLQLGDRDPKAPGRLESLYNVCERVGLGKFARHYVAPLLERRKQENYDAQQFFESWHRGIIAKEFSDRITIRPEHDPLHARYHYSTVEASMVECLAREKFSNEDPAVLDIGSGAGHWISFYLNLFDTANILGIALSRPLLRPYRLSSRRNQM